MIIWQREMGFYDLLFKHTVLSYTIEFFRSKEDKNERRMYTRL